MFSLILTPAQLEDALAFLGSRLEKWGVEFRSAVARNDSLPSDVSPPLLNGTTIFVSKVAVPEARESLLALLARIQARSNHRDASLAERALAPVLRQVEAHRRTSWAAAGDAQDASAPPGVAPTKPEASTLVPLELGATELRTALGVLGSDLHLWRNAIRAMSKARGTSGYDASADGPLLHEGRILVGRRHLTWVKDALDALERSGDTEVMIRRGRRGGRSARALAKLSDTRGLTRCACVRSLLGAPPAPPHPSPVPPCDHAAHGLPEALPTRACASGRMPLLPAALRRLGEDPFEIVTWERRTARITGTDGHVVFEQKHVEVPAGWSGLATDLVASRYFAGIQGTPAREGSVRDLVGRVVRSIAAFARADGLVGGAQGARDFEADLAHLLLHQKAAFNSPVWFNVGLDRKPQASACFILGLEDRLDSILSLAQIEGRIFSKGSGAGTNFSALRGSKEPMSSGGYASGPVAFLRGLDALAGAVKSGGRTRRAAKMALLDADHPDVLEFVRCSPRGGRAHALSAAGLLPPGDAAREAAVSFQNENHSVRVTDAFLEAAQADRPWRLVPRTKAGTPETVSARDLLRSAAEAAHACGDPGLHFTDTIDAWNPVPRTGPIRASNPCSEFMFLDDTACNLASINLLAFRGRDGALDVAALSSAVEVLLLAMEALVGHAAYPTPAIERNSHRLRPLGLGVTNLGALLMASGLPYDSDAGRGLAAGVFALVGGVATLASARLAARVGPFAEWRRNRAPALAVLARHVRAAHALGAGPAPVAVSGAARRAWDEALALAKTHGLRHAQVTCVAPTGTISFLMDADTTGIEPELALVKEKKLVGGGRLRLVTTTLPLALERLGYDERTRKRIVAHVERHGSVEGARASTRRTCPSSTRRSRRRRGRTLSPAAHLLMMAAVQPFVSAPSARR
jgi:adenosylcobalamin-dependent ribonucleoside-diphosphate reductase